jgi:hypothetical protein
VKRPYHTPFLPANGAGRRVERAVLGALAVSVRHDVIVAKQFPFIDHKHAA